MKRINRKHIVFTIIAVIFFYSMACNQKVEEKRSDEFTTTDSLKSASPQTSELDSTLYKTIDDRSYIGQTFTIIFYSLSKNPQGILLGCSQGETRFFYYKAPIENAVINDRFLSFQYVIHDEFAKPFTYENYNVPFENDTIGWNQNGIKLSYSGRISGDSLILGCSSENQSFFYECFGDTLKFIRINNKKP